MNRWPSNKVNNNDLKNIMCTIIIKVEKDS